MTVKIISCYVENFGKLHDYSVDFSDGLNIVCEENGWGKSTFAAFVRAMFYGLVGERKRNLLENERKRYKPWQGGVFGGKLTFEIQGKTYQISRVFYDKEANDEFELRDAQTNLLSKDYSKKIGEEIFQINRESFMRTIFIGQSDCKTSPTDDINAKIGNLADHANDLNHFEEADKKLKEILNSLTPERVTGSIAKRREEIAGYERIVQDGEEIVESLDIYQDLLHKEEAEYEALKERLKETGEEQQKVSKLQSVLAKRSEWERLKKSVLRKKEEAQLLTGKFPGEIPPAEKVKEKISECGDMEKAFERLSMCQVPEAEKAELSALTSAFQKGIPAKEDLEEKIGEAGRLRKIVLEYSSEQMSPKERERLEELEFCFGEDTESVASVVGKWNARNTKKAALPSNQAALTALKASVAGKQPQNSLKRTVFPIIGAVIAIMGVLITIASFLTVGMAMIVAGALMIILPILLGKKKAEPEQNQVSPELERLERIIEEDMRFIAVADQEVSNYLQVHGKSFDEHTAFAALQEITEEAVEYSSLKKKARKAKEGVQAAEIETIRKSIDTFFLQYGIVSSEPRYADDLYALRNKAARYAELTLKREKLEKAQAQYNAMRANMDAFLREYGYEPADDCLLQLYHIRETMEERQYALEAFQDMKAELNRFEAETDIPALEQIQTEENLASLEELNQRMVRLTEEMEQVHHTIINYNKNLEDLQERYDEREECRIKLKELKALQTQEQKKYGLVCKARSKLGAAKEVMTAKYADPLLESFGKYYEMISGDPADPFYIDANAAVTVDELGRQRDTDALSTGYRDLVGICLRTALVDAMYQKERPLLIMDDPFTNLDDEKMRKGKTFLENIAQTYQIIYFTCSHSRS